MRKQIFAILSLLVLYILTPAQNFNNTTPDFISVDSDIRIDIIESEPNTFITPQITTSPNPASNELCVEVYGISGQVKVNIYNTIGKLVKLSRISKFDEKFLIDISDLHEGVYFVRLKEGKNFSELNKLIIQRNKE